MLSETDHDGDNGASIGQTTEVRAKVGVQNFDESTKAGLRKHDGLRVERSTEEDFVSTMEASVEGVSITPFTDTR